ncbi:DUF6279 family lipoprotein [Pseudomonas sp. HK3]
MRVIILLVISLLLGSCSSQFAYRHLDWIILWYADDYLELNRQQERILEGELSQLLAWHEKSELPKYRAQLQSISHDLKTLPLTETVISQHVTSIRLHWQKMRKQISEQLPPLAAKLSAAQITYLFRQLEDRNQERLDEILDLSDAQIKEQQLEKLEDMLIDWLGSINSVQATLLYEFVNTQHDLTRERVAYLRSYQAQLKQKMQQPVDIGALQILLDNPESFKPQAYLSQQQHNRDNIQAFIRQFSVHIQPEQVVHLQGKLQDYIDVIDGILKSSNKKGD